jgi:uncharacterized protein (DUF4415 family)
MAKSGTKSSVISEKKKFPSPAQSKARSVTSSRRGPREKTSEESIIYVSRDAEIESETDWVALRALTDEEINAAIAKDPVWQEFEELDWSDGVVVMPAKKKAISIRIDEDVLDFFKSDGFGYQGRMNAVLRSYMLKVKPKKR